MDIESIMRRAAVFASSTRFANELQAINLAQGIPEPFFDSALTRAVGEAGDAGWQYADARGEFPLRESVARHYGGHWTEDEILITSGCTESLYLALLAAKAEYGGQVVYLEPFYAYYPGLVEMAGLQSVAVPMSIGAGGLQVDWQRVADAVRAGARILLLNTPHNPSGWIMGSDDCAVLAELTRSYGLLTIIDDAYGSYIYENNGVRLTDITSGTKCLVAGSASKTLSATGLRIGWLAGDRALVERAFAHHLYLSYCQPKPLQLAACQLLSNFDQHVGTLKARYISKRNRLADALAGIGLDIFRPSGGHYILAGYQALAQTSDAPDFAAKFARRFGVMPLPATPFYLSENVREVRFSFSVSMNLIDAACDRLMS